METETKYSLIAAIILAIVIIVSVCDKKHDHQNVEDNLTGVITDSIILDTSQNNDTYQESDTSDLDDSNDEEVADDEVEINEQDFAYDYDELPVPSNNSIKSYMDYRYITLKSSKQYALQKSLAYTGDNGIRMVGDRYCIAVGSYYTTTIGQYIDVELENGNVIKGILADCKDDKHTDSTNRINPNGSVVEFVVDTDALDKTAKKTGDISYVNEWNSKIVNIKVYDKVEEF